MILFFLSAPALVLAPIPDHDHPPIPRPDLSFRDVVERGDAIPRLYSMAVDWKGERLLEHYFHGKRESSLANLKSASKSVLSALIGIAIDRGIIPGVDTPISTYFPEIAGDPEKSSITVGNLLAMRAGLRTTSNQFYGAWVSSSNWVRHILTRPMEAAPDEEMIYSTGDTHLLSAILTKAAGMSTWQFGQRNLAEPLGFDLRPWPRDPQGIYFGGNDMVMTPRQMMMIGETYLNNGSYEGRQVVPAGWVEASCDGRPRGGPRNQSYGYGWWVGEFDTFKVCYAWGYGGQYIWVMPELDLVVVATSSPFDTPSRRGHNQKLFDIVEHQIVVPIADAIEWDRLYGDRVPTTDDGPDGTNPRSGAAYATE